MGPGVGVAVGVGAAGDLATEAVLAQLARAPTTTSAAPRTPRRRKTCFTRVRTVHHPAPRADP
jgi:hypothetical protein